MVNLKFPEKFVELSWNDPNANIPQNKYEQLYNFQ